MENGKARSEKIKKTLSRLKKAAEYNDTDYMIELLHDLSDFSYLVGYKCGKEVKSEKTTEQQSTQNKTLQKSSIESKVSSILLEHGIPAHIKGYRYITDAVTMIYNQVPIQSVSKDVYPKIAKKYNTTPNSIGRAIRHAIDVGWNRNHGDKNLFSPATAHTTTVIKKKPTNIEYIFIIVDYISKLMDIPDN